MHSIKLHGPMAIASCAFSSLSKIIIGHCTVGISTPVLGCGTTANPTAASITAMSLRPENTLLISIEFFTPRDMIKMVTEESLFCLFSSSTVRSLVLHILTSWLLTVMITTWHFPSTSKCEWITSDSGTSIFLRDEQ